MSFRSQVPDPNVMREMAITSLASLYSYTLAEREEGANVIAETTKSLVEKGREITELSRRFDRQGDECGQLKIKLRDTEGELRSSNELRDQLQTMLEAAKVTVASLQAQLADANRKLTEATTLRTQRIVLVAQLTQERDELYAKVRQFEASKAAAQPAGMTEERALSIIAECGWVRVHAGYLWNASMDTSICRPGGNYFDFVPEGYSPDVFEACLWVFRQSSDYVIKLPAAQSATSLPAFPPAPESIVEPSPPVNELGGHADAASYAQVGTAPGVNDPDYDNAPADTAPPSVEFPRVDLSTIDLNASPIAPPAVDPADEI